MDKIPISLNPDPLRDSIIEIRYKSEKDFLLLFNEFYSLVKDEFNYIPRNKNQNNFSFTPQGGGVLIIIDSNSPLLFNDNIKIKFSDSSITFNCTTEYIGWNKYANAVESIVSLIFKEKLITEVDRIGLRYINEFYDRDIFSIVSKDIINYFSRHNLKVPIEYRFQYMDENDQRILFNIIGKIEDNNSKKLLSLIDLDVIKEKLSLNNTDEVIKTLNRLHNTEKEIFFDLLDVDFIEKHYNPRYS